MRILFLHGLHGNSDGKKAVYLKEEYDAHVLELDTSELKQLKVKHKDIPWNSIDRSDIIRAARAPLKQVRDAIEEYEPDLIIGSSLGGALLAKMVKERRWEGPCIFLASAAFMLFGIKRLSHRSGVYRHWIHGSNDALIPTLNSMDAAQESHGTCELVDDDHRLETVVKSGTLTTAIKNVRYHEAA